jgi:hemophore-related protein
MLIGAEPAAVADPPPPPVPGCSAGDFEQVTADVSAARAAYMFGHPDVNAFFSGLRGQPQEQRRSVVQAYMATNPQTQSELAGIRQPLHDMKARCQ